MVDGEKREKRGRAFLSSMRQSHCINPCGQESLISYIVAGSAVSYMSHLFSDSGSPLFGSFERMGLSLFDEEDSRRLLQKIVPVATDPVVGRVVHRLTVGHPHYLTAVGRRLESMHYASGRTLDPSTAKEAFLRETLSPEGRIYEFCRYLYDFSLQKARAYAALKSVLAILAEEGRLGISALARRLRVSISTARDYLRWLADVDLVGDEAGEYFLLDPVLRFWIGQVVRGATLPIPSGELIATTELLEELEEAFLRVSSELGIAKESQKSNCESLDFSF